MAISKVNILGTIYDIDGGTSGGGLTGYSSSVFSYASSVVAGILADGTYTKTFSSSDKYIYLILATKNAGLHTPVNCEIIHIKDFGDYTYNYVWLIIPNADEFDCDGSHGGGSNA